MPTNANALLTAVLRGVVDGGLRGSELRRSGIGGWRGSTRERVGVSMARWSGGLFAASAAGWECGGDGGAVSWVGLYVERPAE